MKKIILFIAVLGIAHFSFASGDEKRTDPMVSGNVVDATTKKPLAEVTVTAINTTSKKEHTITTDANGDFKIAQLPIGTYKFKFQKDNYKASEKTNVNVKQETPTKLNIEIVNYKDEEIEDRRNWLLKFDY